jgi:SAM-dependent methyltransferase
MVDHLSKVREFSENGSFVKKTASLVDRYRRLLCLLENAGITESMVMKHWRLETLLAGRILRSSKKNRSETVRRCIKLFYRELDWLNDSRRLDGIPPVSQREKPVIRLIGKQQKRIFEIGSGNGMLIDYLSRHGHECIGSDIDKNRFRVHANPHLALTVQDGAVFTKKVHADFFDTVLSLNVLEHLHPDDVEGHFREVLRSLKRGGEYILKTPHRFFGPHGIERVFGITQNRGLHLKEYTYLELQKFSERSGFTICWAVFMIPRVLQTGFRRLKLDFILQSRFYMNYLMLLERIILSFSNEKNRRRASLFFHFFFLPRQVFVVLKK